MNKVIRGKRYNTDTARLVGAWEANEPKDSDLWLHEKLYMKRGGEFFLVGEGGAMTEYAEFSMGGESKPGVELRPISPDEASGWAEEHLTGDEYEAIFGEIAEDGSRDRICITLPASTIEELRKGAQLKNVQLSKHVEGIITAQLKEEKE